ncbi:hypothetical protein ACFLTV_02170 [Chloroflexota bacterium]
MERNNGHKPFTEDVMYRIASRAKDQYWRNYYKLNNGLTCGNCSSKQRLKCKEEWLYGECPKAIKLENLNKPVIDSEGNTTELGELIADDKAVEARISLLKRKFGLRRSLLQGSPGVNIWVGQGIFAHNLSISFSTRADILVGVSL